ncbi:M10 family metallopeptidase [Mariniblastus fucicola]|uniref:Serralysin B n=1 Tax=Mariniblastus fucicola TaxID=980251 RepID=A0A5B9PET5_9BACT|nr:M10 family metallopeptidase [Mariniblastus fucicola]QEG23715.1 Serralysin B precursor [Mariniblastus fucicola]
MGRPVVEHFNTNIFLNSVINGEDLFSTIDPDGDVISFFRVEDYQDDPTGGFFRLNGVAIPNGTQFRVEAEDLPFLEYVSGSRIGWEGFRVIAVDVNGEFSTAADSGRLYTVRENVTKPRVQNLPFDALADEATAVASFIKGYDPDGYPITQFYIRDRSVDLGFLTLDGEALAQGEYHLIKTEELEGLYYNTTGATSSEKFDIFAYDGELWSERGSYDVGTTANVNRPVAQFTRGDVNSRDIIAIEPLANITDDDGNSIKWYEFWNTSPHAVHGDLLLDGVVQPRKEWIRVEADQLDDLEFLAPDRDFVQQIRYRGYDGKYQSGNGTISITTTYVPPPIPPSIEAVVPKVDVRQLQTFEVDSLFTVNEPGLPATEFQIFDGNSDSFSGEFLLFNSPLATDVVHTLTPAEFSVVDYISGPYIVRSNEGIYARVGNGDWSPWARIEMHTEPEFDQAFFTNQVNPVSWVPILNQGTEVTRLTYSFMQNFPDYETGEAVNNDDPPEQFSQLTPIQRNAVHMGFENLEQFANVEFVQVSDTSTNELGQRGGLLRIGNYFVEDSTAGAFAFFPSTAPQGGDIWLNLGSISTTDMSQGTYSYTAFIHEVGHAMGLKHPHGGNSAYQPGGQEAAPWLPDSTDDQRFSVMTYTFGPAFAWTYQIYDIYNLQTLYGANMSYNTGDDVYSYDSLGGSPDALQAIWDAGGNDTLSAEGVTTASLLDLRAGQLSNLGSFTTNIGIAFNVDIENAIGGDASDVITGNHVDNVLDGGLGNDTIWGGSGNDFMTGGAGSDTFVFGVADQNDTIDEQRLAGRDTIRLANFPQLDSLEEDIRFSFEGRDLIIDLRLDGQDVSDGTLRIVNQTWGGSRIESLELNGTLIDLSDLSQQVTAGNDTFRITETTSNFGNLAVPV